VSGFAAAMGDCDNEHEISFDRVEDGIGKDAGKTPTHVLVERAPAIRIFKNDFNGLLDASDEAQIQARPLRGIVMAGFVVFLERLRVELIPHRPSERRTRARASSPGIACTWPLRTSSRRRLASAAQRRSMWLDSAASRLSTSRSARSASSWLGNVSASAAICSMVIGMRRGNCSTRKLKGFGRAFPRAA